MVCHSLFPPPILLINVICVYIIFVQSVSRPLIGVRPLFVTKDEKRLKSINKKRLKIATLDAGLFEDRDKPIPTTFKCVGKGPSKTKVIKRSNCDALFCAAVCEFKSSSAALSISSANNCLCQESLTFKISDQSQEETGCIIESVGDMKDVEYTPPIVNKPTCNRGTCAMLFVSSRRAFHAQLKKSRKSEDYDDDEDETDEDYEGRRSGGEEYYCLCSTGTV